MLMLVIIVNAVLLIGFAIAIGYELKKIKLDVLEISKCLDNKCEESWNEQMSLAEKYNIIFKDYNYIKQNINKLMERDVLK